MILDTCFLIDAEREVRRAEKGRALSFLEGCHEKTAITFTIAGELAAGRTLSRYEVWRDYISSHILLEYSNEIAWNFGCIYRDLRKDGKMIGANDLWIAATAVVHDMPLVTRNVDEFSRVSGLEIISY
ncbi:MAG: type II toxin-antitoxin system VapC family toxin [Verrucomicrobiota bacterium]